MAVPEPSDDAAQTAAGIEIMSRINSKARLALVTAMGVLLAGYGSIAGVAAAQSGRQQTQPQNQQQGKTAGENDGPSYRSSIQVPNDEKGEKNESGAEAREGKEGAEGAEGAEGVEAQEASNPAEQQESARLQALARITVDQARTAALARVPGNVTAAGIENEDGNLVYGVTIKTATGEQDVKVDAGNGKVLHVE